MSIAPLGTSQSVAASPLNTGPVPFVRGDANCDREIDSIDAALVLQFNAGLITSVACPRVADVNQDDKVDSRDAAIILQIEAALCCVWAFSELDTA
ncbi:MAG: dockerin type I repeat-containing protein [Chloroflexi bacterium]|nr:dockerin type I repeat-containing protein [Chloroflexota bacterium]